MGFNPRLYLRLFQKALVKENPLLIIISAIKKLTETYSELPKQTSSINNSLNFSKTKLEFTKSIIDSETKPDNYNSLNYFR